MARVAAARVSVSTAKPPAGRVLVLLWPRARGELRPIVQTAGWRRTAGGHLGESFILAAVGQATDGSCQLQSHRGLESWGFGVGLAQDLPSKARVGQGVWICAVEGVR